MDDDKQTSDNRPGGLGPGERLQAARIQKSLSVDDVAGKMHLSIAILEAIEDNRFEEITAPIFVKGYLRAYARIVSLDEDEIIQQYVDSWSREDPPITTTSNMAPELSVADVRIKWTTYLVIVILAALLAAWWWNKKQAETPPMTLDSQQEQQLAESDTAAGSASNESSQVSASSVAQSPETETVTRQEAESEAAQRVPEPVEPEPAPAEPEMAEPEAEPAVEPETVADAVTDETTAQIALAEAGEGEARGESTAVEPAPADTGLANNPRLVAPGGSDSLEIVVNADTWADIKDASDFQMVYDLLRAGQTLELTGRAPFSVFLGNGHGVEVRFNGEEVDFSTRIRNDNTTRLRIGG